MHFYSSTPSHEVIKKFLWKSNSERNWQNEFNIIFSFFQRFFVIVVLVNITHMFYKQFNTKYCNHQTNRCLNTISNCQNIDERKWMIQCSKAHRGREFSKGSMIIKYQYAHLLWCFTTCLDLPLCES